MTAVFFADVTILAQDRFFDLVNGIHRRNKPARELIRKHRKIVQMIAASDDFIRLYVEATRNLGESGAFVVGLVTEAGVNIVAHDNEVADFLARDFKVIMDLLGILNFLGNQAEW